MIIQFGDTLLDASPKVGVIVFEATGSGTPPDPAGPVFDRRARMRRIVAAILIRRRRERGG